MERTEVIAKIILSELDSLESLVQLKPPSPTFGGIGGRERHAIYDSQRFLKQEPFIAYIKAKEKRQGESEWSEKIYLICRNFTPFSIDPRTPATVFLSYKAPMGRIASVEVDDELEISVPIGSGRKGLTKKFVIVLEKNIFTPKKESIWDAIDNTFHFSEGQMYLESLRELISSSLDGESLAKEIQEYEFGLEKKEKAKVRDSYKRRRKILETIELKDQPILDSKQDSLFRLPISSQIILSGAPGTGKTTTLIRRLALYSADQSLTEYEQNKIGQELTSKLFSKDRNWQMFTPNELLRNYLKEALNKEELSATDRTVKIWNNERIEIARDVLRFLKIGQNGDGLFTRTKSDILQAKTSKDLTNYAQTFIKYLERLVTDEIVLSIDIFSKNKITSLNNIEEEQLFKEFNEFTEFCQSIIADNRNNPQNEDIGKSFRYIDRISSHRKNYSKLQNQAKEFIDNIVNEFIVYHPDVIKKVSALLLAEKSDKSKTSSEETEEESKVIAKRRIRDSLIWAAENLESDSGNNRNKAVWNQMFSCLNTTDQSILKRKIKTFGQIRLTFKTSQIEKWLKGREALIGYIPEYYRQYRLSHLNASENHLISKECSKEIEENKITDNEIDVLIFVALRFVRRIFLENEKLLSSDSKNNLLEAVKDRLRTQIVVDEAADFSAIQLGCMYYLSHPAFTSVTFAGDLMQRVTGIGLTDWNECQAISSNIRTEIFSKSYRQTPKLLAIASKLYEHAIGEKPSFSSAFPYSADDPNPLKFKIENAGEQLSQWLLKRLLEIYEINDRKLPSIAIFVPEDSDINPLYEEIQEALNEHSIEVDPCLNGRVLGIGSKVRIFSIEYVKGLEFEGVFFVNIDKVYERKPELVDKYLYVGLTRATTFLGVTYSSEFPHKLSTVEEDFDNGTWSRYVE